MKAETLKYQTFLTREFARRRGRNSSYSLRAYARDLGIPATKLSQIFKGKCGLSNVRAMTLAKAMGLSENDTQLFVLSVESQHSRSRAGKLNAAESLSILLSPEAGYENLDLDRFSIIRDWFHFAILELTDVADFNSSPEWIAARLGISATEAADAVARLIEFGLLAESSSGVLVQTQANLATPSGVPSRELRDHHAQILQKAEVALEEVNVSERDVSEITLSIDSSKIAEASLWLKEFRRKFCRDLQEGAHKRPGLLFSDPIFPS